MFFDIGFTSGDIISYIIPIVKAFLKNIFYPHKNPRGVSPRGLGNKQLLRRLCDGDNEPGAVAVVFFYQNNCAISKNITTIGT